MSRPRAHRYEIRIRGHLDERHARRLDGLSVHHEIVAGEPFTVLRGVLPDQAALYGVLGRLGAMNLDLVDLHEREV